jgi:hypothetical protein
VRVLTLCRLAATFAARPASIDDGSQVSSLSSGV